MRVGATSRLKLDLNRPPTLSSLTRTQGEQAAATNSTATPWCKFKGNFKDNSKTKSRRDAGATTPRRLREFRLGLRGRGRVRFRDRPGTGRAFLELCTFLKNLRA